MAAVTVELVSDACDSVRRFSLWRRLSSLGSGSQGWGAMRFGAVAGDEFDGVELGAGDVERQPLGRGRSSDSSSGGGSGEIRCVDEWVGVWMGVFRAGRGRLSVPRYCIVLFVRGCEGFVLWVGAMRESARVHALS